jgi:hypothetical protein
MALPLPPAAEISDIVEGINEMYNGSPLPMTEILVTTATYLYDYPDPAYAVLLVATGFQKTIQIPADVPIGSRILVKDMSGNASQNMVIIEPLNGLLIDGVNTPCLINNNFGSILLIVAAEGVYTVGRYYIQSQYFDSLCIFDTRIDASVTIGSATNGLSVGPLTIAAADSNNNDVVVTVSTGARWVVI